MSDINVVIVDPGGYRFEQRLDSYMAMRALIPILVERLGLPVGPKYQLIPRATGRPMIVTDTLTGIGASPGWELELRPHRDDVFARIVEGLRKKAEGYVVDQLWALAKAELDRLFRLDPDNREAKQLQSQIGIHIDVSPPSSPPMFSGDTAQAATAAGQPASASQWANLGCVVGIVIVVAIAYNNWPEKTKNSNQTNQTYQTNASNQTQQPPESNSFTQTQGSFTVEPIYEEGSYRFRVTASPGDRILVSVRGTDTYTRDIEGVGSLTTEIIKRGKPGVVDTITVRSLSTGEHHVFRFQFQ